MTDESAYTSSRSREERETAMNRKVDGMDQKVDSITQLLQEMRDRMATLEMHTPVHQANNPVGGNQSDQSVGRAPARERRNQPRHYEQNENPFYNQSDSSDEYRPRRQPGRRQNHDDLGGMKLRIPSFYGKNDPDAYLEWEKKIELVFDCQNFTEHRKVGLAATEFHDYAVDWWDQIVTNRRRHRENPVETWAEMKFLMQRRFVPEHYHRELHQRLRRLSQGTRSVEDYYQEMEKLMLKADVEEQSIEVP